MLQTHTQNLVSQTYNKENKAAVSGTQSVNTQKLAYKKFRNYWSMLKKGQKYFFLYTTKGR